MTLYQIPFTRELEDDIDDAVLETIDLVRLSGGIVNNRDYAILHPSRAGVAARVYYQDMDGNVLLAEIKEIH